MDKTGRETLFRRQAVAEMMRSRPGRPIAQWPRAWWWLTGLTVAFALVVTAFVTTGRYTRKETVRGWLVADHGAVRLTHRSAAVVDRVAVEPGSSVRHGDAVVYLSGQLHLESGDSLTDLALLRLHEESDGIDRRMELARSATDVEVDALSVQLDGVVAEFESLAQRRREQGRRVAAARDLLERTQVAAANGAMTEWDVMRQRDRLASQQQALDELRQDEKRLQRERHRLEANREALAIEFERTRVQLETERSRLQRDIAAQETQRMLVLQSPITGKIASVEVVPGNAVRPYELLATILPDGYVLMAEVYVRSRAVGMVRRGQVVNLVYDAFPARQFGVATGRVESVADYVLLPGDLPSTFQISEATYKVRIALDELVVHDSAQAYELRPGMLLAAEILLEERSLLEWLLAPLRRHLVS
jgi:membrane fusion protein